MKRFFTLLTVMVMVLTPACNSLEPEVEETHKVTRIGNGVSVDDPVELLDDGTDPSDYTYEFIITPGDGWVVHPGEIILFQALLYDKETGEYVEVTNNEKCRFTQAQYGKSVNGDDPSLTEGQEITVSAIYGGKIYASSTGHFESTRE